MGATGMNSGGDGTVARALYDTNDLQDSGGGTVSRGPVGDTMGTYGLGTPDDAIGMDGGGHGTDNAVGTFSEDHDEPDEGGIGVVGHGIAVSESGGDVTAPHAILVFTFLHHEPVPHGGLDVDMGLQLFQASPTSDVSPQHLVDLSKPIYGSHGQTGWRLRRPHHRLIRRHPRLRAARYKHRRQNSRRPSRGAAEQLRRWWIWRAHGRALGGWLWQRLWWPQRLGQRRRRAGAATLSMRCGGSDYGLVGGGSCGIARGLSGTVTP
jgi:hypothetical protein